VHDCGTFRVPPLTYLKGSSSTHSKPFSVFLDNFSSFLFFPPQGGDLSIRPHCAATRTAAVVESSSGWGAKRPLGLRGDPVVGRDGLADADNRPVQLHSDRSRIVKTRSQHTLK